MHNKGPLLVVFYCDGNFREYVMTFKEEPVLSYERYEEGKMVQHAVNALGYGVENIVPWWRYMNSYGYIFSKGIGRVLPQNCTYVYGMDGVKVERRERPPPRPLKRQRTEEEEVITDEEEGYARPPLLKKVRLEMLEPMDVDNDMMEVDVAP
jgi:hypothetical protein